MNWQPIETVPKDGTRVLAIQVGNHEITGKPFLPAIVVFDENGMVCMPGYDEEMDEWWSLEEWPLSHWMPLPEPPSE